MKAIKYWVVLIGVIPLLMACEHKVSVETVVHPDGSLDRTIILEKADSSQIDHNYFGISGKTGWEIELDSMKSQNDSSAAKKKKKLVIRFRKHFSSYQESNQELSSPVDTLFKVKSTFEKKFKWFYTYLYYSDTYGALDRLDYVSQEDYFTPEDYAFIDRLPAEGHEISKADKLFLEKLQEKIFDRYALRGIFEEEYHLLITLVEMHKLEQRWLDTLHKHKEPIYNDLKKKEDWDNDILLKIADSLSIPLPSLKDNMEYEVLKKELNAKLDFMSYFNEAIHTHGIKMPWPVIKTNADSISGSHLIWQPPITKFLLKDYQMYAESRKMNYWAVIVSIIIVILTVFITVKKRYS